MPPEIKGTLDLRLQAHLLESYGIEELNCVARSAEDYHYSAIQSSAKLKVRMRSPPPQKTASNGKDIGWCDPASFTASSEPWHEKQIGQYRGQRVMVEWKPCSQDLSLEELKQRVFSIATFLRDTNENKPDDLIILDCMGAIITNDSNPNVGLMYSIPPSQAYEEPPTLYDILSDQQKFQPPPLEHRRNLAVVLAKAVFQLHVVGCFIKGYGHITWPSLVMLMCLSYRTS